MNENNANLCEMEQEIFQIKDKYKPYFELEKENRRLKIERLEMLHTAEKFLFALIAALLVDLLNKMIFVRLGNAKRNAILCKAFFFTHWRRYKVPSASVLVQRK